MNPWLARGVIALVLVGSTAALAFGLSFALVPLMGLWAAVIVWPLCFIHGLLCPIWIVELYDRLT